MEPSSGDSNTNENSANTTTVVSSDKKPEPSETTTTTQAPSTSSSSSSSSSWWNSLLQTAKEKSATAIEIMRSDLAEFKSTMSADTNRLVTTLTHVDVDSTASAATGNLLNSLSSLSNALGINSLISGMTSGDELAPTTNENEKKPAVVVTSPPPPGNVHDRFKADLKQLQTDETTFLTDVQSPEFESWVASFNSDEFKSTISDLLIENSATRLIYSQLVPAQMSNNQFWSRYFFKVNQLEDDYKKRVQLLEKASRTATIEATSNKESNDWDDDDSPSQNSTTKAEKNDDEDTSMKQEAEKSPITAGDEVEVEEEEEKVTKETTQSNSSTAAKPEESDDWEKLSDVDNQVDQSKKKVEKEDTTEAATVVEADSSKLSEVEVSRSNNRKEAENDWEDWDE